MSRLVSENPNVKRFTTNVALSVVKRGLTIPIPLDSGSMSAKSAVLSGVCRRAHASFAPEPVESLRPGDVSPGQTFRMTETLRAADIWDDYRPTPLIELPRLARLTNVGRVFVKAEGERSLGSFKMLGGMVAGLRALARAAGVATLRDLRLDADLSGVAASADLRQRWQPRPRGRRRGEPGRRRGFDLFAGQREPTPRRPDRSVRRGDCLDLRNVR